MVDAGARRGRDFIAERTDPDANVFEAAVAHIRDLKAKGHRVIVAAWSEGSRERLIHVLDDHGFPGVKPVARYADALAAQPATDRVAASLAVRNTTSSVSNRLA